MKMLKMAPMSEPSMTFMPTASPASARRNHRFNAEVSDELEATKPSAKKSMAMATCCGATPQQAVEKNVEFNAAASPPKAAASGENFSCRKKNHAPRPSSRSANAVKNLE